MENTHIFFTEALELLYSDDDTTPKIEIILEKQRQIIKQEKEKKPPLIQKIVKPNSTPKVQVQEEEDRPIKHNTRNGGMAKEGSTLKKLSKRFQT
eukprot:gene8402-227_t